MRHKYPTKAIVLSRTPIAEESLLIALLTKELGLVRARAQGIRKMGAKLAAALPTLAESDVVLVAGKDGWRISGALLSGNHFYDLVPSARARAGRIATLLLRLVHGESPDAALYAIYESFLAALRTLPEAKHDAAELLAALRTLAALGLDGGEAGEAFDDDALALVEASRRSVIARVNRGIAASGL